MRNGPKETERIFVECNGYFLKDSVALTNFNSGSRSSNRFSNLCFIFKIYKNQLQAWTDPGRGDQDSGRSPSLMGFTLSLRMSEVTTATRSLASAQPIVIQVSFYLRIFFLSFLTFLNLDLSLSSQNHPKSLTQR